MQASSVLHTTVNEGATRVRHCATILPLIHTLWREVPGLLNEQLLQGKEEGGNIHEQSMNHIPPLLKGRSCIFGQCLDSTAALRVAGKWALLMCAGLGLRSATETHADFGAPNPSHAGSS